MNIDRGVFKFDYYEYYEVASGPILENPCLPFSPPCDSLSFMSNVPDHRPGGRVTEATKAWFYREVRKGRNPFHVGEQIGVGRSTVRRMMKAAQGQFVDAGENLSPVVIGDKLAMGNPDAVVKEVMSVPDPVVKRADLPNEYAKKAWDEFGYYRVRYFNRRHIPWQIEMAQILMSWWEIGRNAQEAGGEIAGGDNIKGIINTPPGGGKTTTVTHDFPAWLISKNRNLRVALGARTTGQAERYVRRLKNTLEKNLLLNVEFGRFKPLEPEIWRRDQFIVDGVTGHAATMEYKLALAGFDPNAPEVKLRVEDPEDTIHEIIQSLENVFITGEKETTVMALSQEMGFLGGRFDLNLWDDLCDKNNSRTPDQREALVEWWFAEAESRCEPGGIVALIGTRFGKYDLYRHCKDLTYQTEDDVTERLTEAVTGTMTSDEIAAIREEIEKEMVDEYGYTHSELMTPQGTELRHSRPIYYYHRFPAHNEAKCKHPKSLLNKDHISCVLDPQRFNYRFLQKRQSADPRKYNLTYQQIDEVTEENLVQTIWLTGGQDKKNIIYPGCYNYDRKLLEIPKHLNPEDCFSIATVDPSAQNWWSIQWWIWDAKQDRDYLINLYRARLSAGNFLDWNRNSNEYRGVVHDWQMASALSGWPIALWIIEQNAAQRYLFQYQWVQEWMRDTRTLIKGHETQSNRHDTDFGVETIGPRYSQGLVDLPFDQSDPKTRVVIGEFAKELTEWPDSLTEDMVMGHWFLHYNRYRLSDSLRVSRARKGLEHPFGYIPDYVGADRAPTTESRTLSAQEVGTILHRPRH